MAESWAKFIETVAGIGLGGLGVLAVAGVLSGLLVPWFTVRDIRQERNLWRTTAMTATDNARALMEAARNGVREDR